MKPRRLAVILIRQWMLFAGVVAALFSASALLLLFLVEDSFIDRRLVAAAETITAIERAPRVLAPGFRAYPATDAPLDVHARLPWAVPGEPFEMRRADGTYIHALLERTPSGEAFVLIYDATGELTISRRWRLGLLLTSIATAATLLGAFFVARAFANRVGDDAAAVVARMKETRDPAQLRTLAGTQQVRELEQLLLLHADAWEAELASVERERATLTHLAHELRTPLQSADTSLAILTDDPDDPAAWQRLRRAVIRLGRSSTAVLWMSSVREAIPQDSVEAVPAVRALVDEFTPFAEARQQRIELDAPHAVVWTVPLEIVDAILGNLLMNAIQHGSPGTIGIRIERDAITLRNHLLASSSGGFGIGLQIVHRLVARIGWRLDVREVDGTVDVRLDWPAT